MTRPPNVHTRLLLVTAVAALVIAGCGSNDSDAGGDATAPVSATATATTTTTAANGSGGTAAPATTAEASTTVATTAPPTTAPPTTVPVTTIAVTTTTEPEPTGWMIKDALPTGASGLITNYDALSCDSELGPWHIVSTFSVPGNLTNDVFYDVTIGGDGTGPLTGEEHSTWSTGLLVDGTYAGTATMTAVDGGGFALALEIDATLNIHDPQIVGREDSIENSHISKTLSIVPADDRCD